MLAIVALLSALPVAAQEPVGCDKFKWPLDKERAMLAHASPIGSGDEVKQPLASAFKVALTSLADAKLPLPPTRAPKDPNSYAGYLQVSAPPRPGIYRITLSQGAWIDVFQDGHAIKSGAFSGALGCEGVRKSVKFNLTAAPLVIEISGAAGSTIGIALTQD